LPSCPTGMHCNGAITDRSAFRFATLTPYTCFFPLPSCPTCNPSSLCADLNAALPSPKIFMPPAWARLFQALLKSSWTYIPHSHMSYKLLRFLFLHTLFFFELYFEPYLIGTMISWSLDHIFWSYLLIISFDHISWSYLLIISLDLISWSYLIWQMILSNRWSYLTDDLI